MAAVAPPTQLEQRHFAPTVVPCSGTVSSAPAVRTAVTTESPQTRHAARDLREPVSRHLSGSRPTSTMSMSPDCSGLPGESASGMVPETLSPSVAPCSSPMDVRFASAGLYPISDHDRSSKPVFGGSLVEPGSLVDGISPVYAPMDSTPGQRRFPDKTVLSPGVDETPLPPPDFNA